MFGVLEVVVAQRVEALSQTSFVALFATLVSGLPQLSNVFAGLVSSLVGRTKPGASAKWITQTRHTPQVHTTTSHNGGLDNLTISGL